jgi:hypothetical protein
MEKPRVHITQTDKINHLTTHPKYLQKEASQIENDQTTLRNYVQRFLEDELSDKGLNYATSHYLNGSERDPIGYLESKKVLSHTFTEGNLNFLIDYFEKDQIRSRVEVDYPDCVREIKDEDLLLNRFAKKRVNQKRAVQKALAADEREELRKQLYNMFFRMKEVVRNLNDENPQEGERISEEQRLQKEEGIKKFLLPRRQKPGKEDPNTAKSRNKAFREYFQVKSDELKDVIYEDIFFEENMNKNQNDEIMKKLTERLGEKSYEDYKRIGGDKTKQFLRLLMVRELMMKEERDQVIAKRLEEQKRIEEEEEEVKRILKNYQIEDDKKKKIVSKMSYFRCLSFQNWQNLL